MKICSFLLLCLALSACRPVRDTKNYYNAHINPKASIDYANPVCEEVPAAFLDAYYAVDSAVVRFVDQIDLLDSNLDAAWIANQKATYPWIKSLAVFNREKFFVAGDDSLGFEPDVYEALSLVTGEKKRFFLLIKDRVFLAHVATLGNEDFRTTFIEMDMRALTNELHDSKAFISFEGHLFGSATELPGIGLKEIYAEKKYAGNVQFGDTSIFWIRSMAADNLFYIYEDTSVCAK